MFFEQSADKPILHLTTVCIFHYECVYLHIHISTNNFRIIQQDKMVRWPELLQQNQAVMGNLSSSLK